MTILEILTGKRVNNKVLNPALEVIKDSYGDIRHDNYEIVVDNEGDLQVKIPSLVKKDEYEYKKINFMTFMETSLNYYIRMLIQLKN